MKRKITTVLVGSALAVMMCGSSVQATTYGYDMGEGKIVYIYEDYSPEKTDVSLDERPMAEYDLSAVGLTEEEKERLSAWHKVEMQEQVAYLEKYGVTYDEDKDRLFYQGKTVRWLIDQQIDDTYVAIQMPEGEIDVYTVRDKEYHLTGVRIATEEEYEERTGKEEKDNIYIAEDGSVIHTFVYDTAVAGVVMESVSEESVAVTEDYYDTETQEEVSIAVETSVCEGDSVDSCYETEEKRREYKEQGIGYDAATGAWIWQGRPVHYLMDEDGSIYQNGCEEAVVNKIYLVVKRNEDGRIKEVKQITLEEVMAELILKENVQ